MHSFFYMRTFFHMLKGLELVFWKSKKWTLIHHWLCLLYINSLRHWFKRHQLPHSTILTSKHREGWVCGINAVTLKNKVPVYPFCVWTIILIRTYSKVIIMVIIPNSFTFLSFLKMIKMSTEIGFKILQPGVKYKCHII